MAWEDDKSTTADPDNPNADEQLTADEWDTHVGEGHWLPSNFQLGQNGDGDPIITDPQNADETVLRYDRSAGEWVLPAISTDEASITNLTAVLELTGSNVSIPQDTDTTVPWNTTDIDTDIYTFDGTNDDVDVDVAGDYSVDVGVEWVSAGLSGGEIIGIKILVNGSVQARTFNGYNGGATGSVNLSRTLKDLAVDDTIRIDVRTDSSSGADIVASDSQTFATIVRAG